MLRAAILAMLILAGLPARAADIESVFYDAAEDELVVDIVYLGTSPDHDFTVQWDRCFEVGGPPAGVAGRLVDQQGDDTASEEFWVTERIGLGGLPCRPAEVTLRLGKASHARVYVPAPPDPASLAAPR